MILKKLFVVCVLTAVAALGVTPAESQLARFPFLVIKAADGTIIGICFTLDMLNLE